MELHLKIIGISLIVLSLLHAFFPKYFHWKENLQSLSLINQQLMYVHTFFIGIILLLTGLFSYFQASTIVSTTLGKYYALGMFIFWFLRLLFQFFVFSSKLWKGKLFETTIHILFVLLWSYLSFIFLMIALDRHF